MLTKLILKDYTPLVKKGVNEIIIDSIQRFNILLGRNGFGKTSLLREMSPLPPDSTMFGENGYKEIHYIINKNQYVLKSKIGKKPEHSFVLNEKELNEGKTFTVQRELVKLHFGINNEIKNILMGLDQKDLFTNLSQVRRKNFLMEINPNNTTVALKIFERAKRQYLNTKGTLKNQRGRLVLEQRRQEELKTLSPEELNKQVSQLDSLIKEALIIHGQLMNVEDPPLMETKSKIENILSQLLTFNYQVSLTYEMAKELKQKSEHQFDLKRERIKHIQDNIQAISDKINDLNLPEEEFSKTPDGNISLVSYYGRIKDLEESAINLQNEIIEKTKQIEESQFFKQEDIEKESFIYQIDEFKDFITNVVCTDIPELTSQEFLLWGENIRQLENEISHVERDIETQQHTLNHFYQSQDVTCPDCDAKFKLGYEKFNPKKIQNDIDGLVKRLELLKLNLKDQKQRYEDNEDWYLTMKSLYGFVKRSKVSYYLIDIIKHFNIGKARTTLLVKYLDLIRTCFYLEQEHKELIARITSMNVHYKLLQETDINTLFLTLEQLNENLFMEEKYLALFKRDIERANKEIEIHEHDFALRNQLDVLIDELHVQLIERGKYAFKEEIVSIINDLTPQKEKLVTDLIRSESLSSVITSLEENINDLEKREIHYKAIMDGLSPSTGYIGHLQIDFINTVVSNINANIDPVWTSRLSLLPCGFTEEEGEVDLDYKFPVVTSESNSASDDIVKCSGGEKDIINNFFRYVMLMYLGERCGIPFMMDEVGVFLDELNRAALFVSVSEKLRLDQLPQTFMISHYVNQYGMFNNEANIIALNTDGLTIPLDVNENVVLN